jgi:hypothetical protein
VPSPFLRDPLIQKPSETTDKIHDHGTTLKIFIPLRNNMYLISPHWRWFRAPHLLNTGGGTRVFRRGVPAFHDENDDDGVIVALLHDDVAIVALLQVALRAVVLQPVGLSAGCRDWLVVSTFPPQALGPKWGWCWVLFWHKLQAGVYVRNIWSAYFYPPPRYVFASQFPQFLLNRSDWLNFYPPPICICWSSFGAQYPLSLQYVSKVPYHQHAMYSTREREREMSTLLWILKKIKKSFSYQSSGEIDFQVK